MAVLARSALLSPLPRRRLLRLLLLELLPLRATSADVPWDAPRSQHSAGAPVDRPRSTEEGCIPLWYTQSRDNGTSPESIVCPYGRRLPGDITYQNDLSLLENTICVFYGCVPILVIGIAVCEFLCVRGTRELFFVMYVLATTALNELGLKKIMEQARPPKSCAITCGMPSSHSTFALGFFMVMFLDAASRVNPMDVGGGASQICGMVFLRGPLSNPVTLSNRAFVYHCLLWALLLWPVPLSRIYLNDHTTEQVIIGSIAGVLYAFVFFYAVYEPFAKYMADKENWRWPRNPRSRTHLLKNTIMLPWWRKRINPHQVSIVDTAPDDNLVCGRSLVRVEVPVQLARRDGAGGPIGIVHGQKLQVFGGHWSGVAWPIKQDGDPFAAQDDGSDLDSCKSSPSDSSSESSGRFDDIDERGITAC